MSTIDLSVLQPISQFAAAIGVCVAAIYYVLNLRISQRNQELSLKAQQQTLETRQTQLLISIFAALNTKEIHTSFHTIDFLGTKSVKELITKMKEDKDFYGDVAFMLRYFNSIGFLVKAKLLDPEKVYEILHEPAVYLWMVLGDYIRYNSQSIPDFLPNIEYLAEEMLKIQNQRHPDLKTSTQ
jgi:hypothetical protein